MDGDFTIDTIDDLIAAFEYFSWTKENLAKLRLAIDKYEGGL